MSKGQQRDTQMSGNRRQTFGTVLSSIGQGKGDGGGDGDCNIFWNMNKLNRLGSQYLRSDDDAVDRLNYRYSVLLIFGFISLIGLRQYVGKPIQCWIPQEFTRGWEEYSENYCWVASTYFAPISQRLPSKIDRQKKIIGYYQWTPIILAMQGFFFYIPYLLWRLCSSHSIFNLPRLLQISETCLDNHSIRSIAFTARYVDLCIQRLEAMKKTFSSNNFVLPIFLRPKSSLKSSSCNISLYFKFGQNHGNFLLSLYCFIKIIYLFNIIGQLIFMERVFGSSQSFFGIRILWDILKGREWTHSGSFPRVTFCDLEAKKLGKNNLYTIQCVLPMNLFLEKIFIFLWFWHVVLALVTFGSLIWWLKNLSRLKERLEFIRKFLLIENAIDDTDRSTTKKFVSKYLQTDGVFLIHMVALSVGELAASKLVVEMWSIYRHKGIQSKEVGSPTTGQSDKMIKNTFWKNSDINSMAWNDDIV